MSLLLSPKLHQIFDMSNTEPLEIDHLPVKYQEMYEDLKIVWEAYRRIFPAVIGPINLGVAPEWNALLRITRELYNRAPLPSTLMTGGPRKRKPKDVKKIAGRWALSMGMWMQVSSLPDNFENLN